MCNMRILYQDLIIEIFKSYESTAQQQYISAKFLSYLLIFKKLAFYSSAQESS